MPAHFVPPPPPPASAHPPFFVPAPPGGRPVALVLRWPGPAAWPAAAGAMLIVFWLLDLRVVGTWAILPTVLLYPLFVWNAEHRRCRELLGGADAALQFGLGVVAAFLWALPPSVLSTLAGVPLSFYSVLSPGAVFWLLRLALVFMPFLYGLAFRYFELWLGSVWALVLVTAIYVGEAAWGGAGVTASFQSVFFVLAWPALTGALYGLAYLLTRRLWLPIRASARPCTPRPRRCSRWACCARTSSRHGTRTNSCTSPCWPQR